jgi:hypothetical protein
MLTTFAAVVRTVRRLVLRVRYLSVCFELVYAEAKARRLRERLAQADAEVEFYDDWRQELKAQNTAMTRLEH